MDLARMSDTPGDLARARAALAASGGKATTRHIFLCAEEPDGGSPSVLLHLIIG